MTRKGKVTIPAHIRRLLELGPHDTLTFLVSDGQVRIASATSVVARTAGMLRSDMPAQSPEEEAMAAEATASDR